MRRKTTEEFISDAKEVHGDKYSYSKTNYTGALKKVSIICPKHGEFNQAASNHLQGHGCPKCANELCKGNYRKKNTTDFVQNAVEIHGNLYDYSKTKYTLSTKKVVIRCKLHGEFYQSPFKHLQGQGCPECGILKSSTSRSKTNDEFVSESKLIHGDRYSYKKVKYKTSNTKVLIKCKDHGYFSQIPSNHLNGAGCPECAKKYMGAYQTISMKEFISRCKKHHGDKYDYRYIKDIHALSKIDIICPIHGVFTQNARDHYTGSGCQECANENVNGWTSSSWFRSAKASLNFHSFKVYVISLSDKNESFYKVGRTYRKLDKRFFEIPYNTKIIDIIERTPLTKESCKEIYELEKSLKNKNNIYRYIPTKKFGGMYECFKELENYTI